MAAYLLASRRILGSDLLSASVSNQAGLQALVAVPGTGNVGSMSFDPDGTPTTVINERLEIVAEGDLKTATFKASADGGTNYKGRRADTAWEDGAGGTTPKTVIADSGVMEVSRPVGIDRDGDGIIDRVLRAVDRGDGTANIYYTDTLDGTGSWTLLSTDIASTDAVGVGIALLVREGVLYYFYVPSAGLSVIKSTDYGVTWGAPILVDSGAGCQNPDVTLVSSGKMLLVYEKNGQPPAPWSPTRPRRLARYIAIRPRPPTPVAGYSGSRSNGKPTAY